MTDATDTPTHGTSSKVNYRPASHTPLDAINPRVEPADVVYLMKLTDALNTTLDLQTLLNRTSELVRAVINYRIFAIFLLNDRTHELRMRFQIGHTPQVERTRVRSEKEWWAVALTRQPILLNDVAAWSFTPARILTFARSLPFR